ncbi:MAG TPA: ABC transporter permease subunit [Blastocatellia bacterium]|nr:ABC transporter permease subunit [Blastocatellia bacterium]
MVKDVSQAARVSYESSPYGYGRLTFRRLFIGIVFVALLVLFWYVAEIHPSALIDPQNTSAVWNFVRQLFPPDPSLEFLVVVARAVLQTIVIAIVSTFLSVVIGLVLGYFATPVLWERGVMLAGDPTRISTHVQTNFSRLVRAVLGFLRAVPDLVWGLFFVVAVGLGALAGTLALAISYTGVLGRVYAHLFEDVDLRAPEALHAAGATRLQVFLRAIWPQAASNVTAYTLYSFECCVRAAAVLGFIGAGGIGYEINLSMRLFKYDQVLTLIIALVIIVALTESLSRVVRRRLLTNTVTSRRRSSRWQGERLFQILMSGTKKALWPLIVLSIGFSFYLTGFFDGAFSDAGIFVRIARFVARMFPPNFELAFLYSLLMPLIQTLAISVIGTLMGIIIGVVLAIPATSTLILGEADSAGTQSWPIRALRRTIYILSRLILNALRSIPELVWVLVCIIAVGLGPFAGTIAIGLHTGGVLGKLYAETLEEVPMRPIEAMRAIGGRPLQLLFWAIWPQARPTIISYTALRWEMNLRVSTVLGLVGGGGLGQIIYNNIQLGFYTNLATLIMLVYIMVVATDWLSHRLRAHSPAKLSPKNIPI